MRLRASILIFGLLIGCAATVPEGRFACERDDDCPDEMVCRTNVQRCFATDGDAGAMREPGERADRGS